MGFKQVQETGEGINFDKEARKQDHKQRQGQPVHTKHFWPAYKNIQV